MQKSQSNREYISPITLSRHVCVCVCVCMYVCVCVCTYVCMYVLCMYVCVCVCMYYVCMYYVCVYVCMYVLCMCVCTYVCMYVCICCTLKFVFLPFTINVSYSFTSMCDLYVTRTTILKHFLSISYEVLSFETMHYEFHLQLFHPTPFITTTSTTAYSVLPKLSAMSQSTLGTLHTAHEEQNGLH